MSVLRREEAKLLRSKEEGGADEDGGGGGLAERWLSSARRAADVVRDRSMLGGAARGEACRSSWRSWLRSVRRQVVQTAVLAMAPWYQITPASVGW